MRNGVGCSLSSWTSLRHTEHVHIIKSSVRYLNKVLSTGCTKVCSMLSIYQRYIYKIDSTAIRCWLYPKGYKCRWGWASYWFIRYYGNFDINGRSPVISISASINVCGPATICLQTAVDGGSL